MLQDGLEIRKEYTKAAAMLMEWVPKLNKDYELAKTQSIKGKEAVSVASQPILAAGLGFGPRYSPPKGDVLPLDDPAIRLKDSRK